MVKRACSQITPQSALHNLMMEMRLVDKVVGEKIRAVVVEADSSDGRLRTRIWRVDVMDMPLGNVIVNGCPVKCRSLTQILCWSVR